MKIQRLKMEDYKEKPFEVRYQTKYLYEPALHQTPDCLGVLFQRTALDEPMSCGFDDVWGSSWLESPQLYALYDNDEIAGMIEVSMESWTQRLRISNLLIKPAYRKQGYAGLLISHVKHIAQDQGIRCIILETQSCNDPAIQCYLLNGFVFLGCDMSCRSNTDIEKHDVRMEMGFYLS